MSTTSHSGWRRVAFYTFTFLSGLWFWVFLAEPTAGRVGHWMFGQALWVAGAWKFRPLREKGETPVLQVQAPEPARVESASAQGAPAKGGGAQELHVDLSEPGKLLDCCFNCGNRALCYKGQRELVANWDYVCDEYQRDDALDVGRVVDMGRGRR